MDEIRIPNDATYAPFSLTDVIATAPLASRLLLGATLPGRVLSAAALGVYAGSALKDWYHRQDMVWIDFEAEFGSDVKHLDPMPEEARHEEITRLAKRLNDGFTTDRQPREELAKTVNKHLTEHMAHITGQRVQTSSEVRDFTLAKLIFPFAMGACDVISGDVAIFKDVGIFEAHVICHEFVHRQGYWKELHAQVLSYLRVRPPEGLLEGAPRAGAVVPGAHVVRRARVGSVGVGRATASSAQGAGGRGSREVSRPARRSWTAPRA